MMLVFLGQVPAQRNLTTDSPKAEKIFKEALQKYRLREHKKALRKVNQALQEDADFIEAYVLKGQIFEERQRYRQAIRMYKRVIQMDVSFYPRILHNTGELEYQTGRYKEARKHFVRYREREDTGPIKDAQAERYIERCDFALQQKAHPVEFDPKNLGRKVNSPRHDYWPSISADGQTLVFTRLVPRKDLDQMEQRLQQMNQKQRQIARSMMSKEQEDFFIARRSDSGWEKATNLGKPINTDKNEGAQSLSADGKTMFFSACNQPGGKGGCDIYISRLKQGQWSKPKNLGAPVNTEGWESQPSISPDGQTLYFASNRKGGKGKKDIWLSHKKGPEQWGKPVNLGESINTPENEMAPFIHMDNQTLYFASEGWMGMGGLDLFKATRRSDQKWSHPENLGYPINTHNDEFGLVVGAAGTKAYFASDRNQKDDRDLYTFTLHREARPTPSSYMRGKVYDAKTHQPLKAKFELVSLDSARVVMESYSDAQSGEFLVCIPTNNNYLLNVSKDQYLFYSDHFTLKGVHEIGEPYEKDVPLKPIEPGRTFVLRNVFFETDSFRLQPHSRVELNKLYRFLRQNPSVRIEVSGHTDSVGTQAYNRELSHKRARSVYDYLIEKGIAPRRLEYEGYGESQPIAPNATPEGRARNRRTQIRILEAQNRGGSP